MAPAAQSDTKVVVVVQLTVLHCPDPFVLVRERLVSTLDVDDAQPADTERDSISRVRTTIVWTAMRHCVGHPVEGL
jgi:hypothetical protein